MRAFTLIETLIALAIASSVLMLALTVFVRQISLVADHSEKTHLISVAKEALYLYESGRKTDTKGSKEGIEWSIAVEDAPAGLSKVVITASTNRTRERIVAYRRK